MNYFLKKYFKKLLTLINACDIILIINNTSSRDKFIEKNRERKVKNDRNKDSSIRRNKGFR